MMWRSGTLATLAGQLGFMALFSVVFIQFLGVAGLPLGVAVGLAIAEGVRRSRDTGRPPE